MGEEPKHGAPPALVPVKKKWQYVNTCTKRKLSYNDQFDGSSVVKVSDAQVAPELESPLNTEPNEEVGSAQTAQFPVPASSPSSPGLNEISYNTDTSVVPDTGIDLEAGNTVDYSLWDRSVRKSPRDFRT